MGIKAEDLRVGNLLFWGDAVVKVLLIKIDGWLAVEYGEDKRYIHVDLCKPIPLTEEWLIKFGFDFKFLHERIKIYSLGEFQYRDSRYKRGLTHRKLGRLSNTIQHVHQLQNLYYALTGAELTIK